MSEPRTSGRPNILWVSVEDINPLLGCYGDRYARTPNLDALAADGIRYTNAHSMAPVCSVSRAAIITGVVSFALGTHHHRSTIAAPEHLRLLPAYLRDAGYFTSNCVKTDYNLAGTSNAQSDAAAPLSAAAWNAWSGSAHWRQRGAGQPFFAVYNYTECHSFVTKDSDETILAERLTLLQPDDFHDPEQAPLPPYHPDIPEFRKAWSRYYDAVTQIDYHVGRHVAELQEDGLWDDTIVVFWADHGTGMLRAKHWGWEQGDHVPLIVRFPPRWQHLAPAAPGAVVEDPVTTLDLTASTLSMVGLPVPDYMHSRPVLCAGAAGAGGAVHRPYVVTGRDRLDTRFELVRAVRARHLRYQRNFFPHLPYFPYETSIYWSGYIHAWDRLARAGKLVGPQRQIAAQRKPFEELYDGASDPWFVDDLVPAGEHAAVVDEMRRQLYDWMIEHRDLGLIDEPELHERAAGGPLWLVGQQCDNYEDILDTADLSRRGAGQRAELLRRLDDADSAIRFWAVTGLVVLRCDDQAVVDAFTAALGDPAVSVRIAAADGLIRLRRYAAGLPALIAALEHPLPVTRGRAANVLDSQPPSAAPHLRPALEPLRRAIVVLGDSVHDVQYRFPMERAVDAIEGSTAYYRWPDEGSSAPA